MDIYVIIVVVLFAFAISDLVVGVSNDAVNFLNSAIGSNAASFRTIMIVASLGIIVGTTFSSGMMEVARKGIFHPDKFYFAEIMIIFFAVMITDILLLDLFNTFGLPTSTTVSIVFELLGAAVAISVIKIMNSDDSFGEMASYINSEKALMIITGILLSIVVAFTLGAIIQYLTRVLFTFNYIRNIKYFGSVWGGIAITAITYFILIKGAKGSSFISPENLEWIKTNSITILIYSFIGWCIILQLLCWIVKLNILKMIVLVGTFALAMAFAGNDLVNFIGVPLAGFKSFQAFQAAGSAEPNQFLMVSLTGKVQTDTYLLLIAGLIMVITLWLSKKARSVTETEINLGRQDVGHERFGSSYLARSLVRSVNTMYSSVKRLMPNVFTNALDRRFDQRNISMVNGNGQRQYFDLLRASVNLVVASIIISFATSLKLPLSTTYVTFMVAMGTSLTDRAWGRDSAVFRITGVFTVVGGWFLTAFIAFTVAFIIACIIHWGGLVAMGVLIVIAVTFIIRTHRIHRKREKEKKETRDLEENTTELEYNKVLEDCTESVTNTFRSVRDIYNKALTGLAEENRKKLKETYKDVLCINKKTKKLKDNIHHTVELLQKESVETGHYYVQVLDYLRETAHCLTFITGPGYNHIDNNLQGLTDLQIKELSKIRIMMTEIFDHSIKIIEARSYSELNSVLIKQQELINLIHTIRKEQIKRIQKHEVGTRNSMLYLGIIHESKSLLLYAINLLKAQRDFAEYKKIS